MNQKNPARTWEHFAYVGPRQHDFVAENGVPRIEEARPKRLFLPSISKEGRDLIKQYSGTGRFFRSQMLHYGLEYKEEVFRGNGIIPWKTFKEKLENNRCAHVPRRILGIRPDLRREYLADRVARNEITEILRGYFLYCDYEKGKRWIPDEEVTTEVIVLPCANPKIAARLCREAKIQVQGLYHSITSITSSVIPGQERYVFLGWDEKGVQQSVHYHEIRVQEKHRTALRDQYLTSSRTKINWWLPGIPDGQYLVDSCFATKFKACKYNMSFSIHETSTPGIFQADFDFDSVAGVMLLCANRQKVEAYVDELEEARKEEEKEEEMGFLKSLDFVNDTGANQRVTRSLSKMAKEARSTAVHTLEGGGTIMRRGCIWRPSLAVGIISSGEHQPAETGFGIVIRRDPRVFGNEVVHRSLKVLYGWIEFDSHQYTRFNAKVNLHHFGSEVRFTGRKISSTPVKSGKSWWGD